jgi:hypothetical protein
MNIALSFFKLFKHPFFRRVHSRTVDIRVFGVSTRSYSHETLGIEKDFPGIPEIYGVFGWRETARRTDSRIIGRFRARRASMIYV